MWVNHNGDTLSSVQRFKEQHDIHRRSLRLHVHGPRWALLPDGDAVRNSPKQFAAHLTAQGKHVPAPQNRELTGYPWPHLQPMRAVPPTVRPPAPDVSPTSLRALAAEMRADASRWLARANDLEQAAKRLEEA